MGKIVVLDELTINQIAAGEVIERPASVIKEMVENSIDAGAKNITVDIKNGGISYIRIADDGKGIEKEDLELSFERHATSKIRKAEDLNEVKSMGFRGEALASIAAIAKVEMISKTADAEIGNKIIIEGGDIKEITECGAPTGTTITVQELFFNTPVRYKFLKKDYTEAGYIEDVMTHLALVNPDISFKLTNSGKTILQTSGDGNIKNIIYSIYGKMVAQACLTVNYEYEGINITGVVGKPEIARSNRSNQIFFVNKRYVKDKSLTAGAEKAFKGMIPIGKFGFLILNLEMSPSLVDVNVHPAKLEVRFQEEQKVFKAIYYSLQDTLLKAELIANSETPITGKFEKNIEEGENMEEEEQKSTISGLFRKIAKNADEGYDDNNLIESIYKSKNENYDGDNMIESIFKSKNGDVDPEEMEVLNELGQTNNTEKFENKLEEEKPSFENTSNIENNSEQEKMDFASRYSQWLPQKSNTQDLANQTNINNINTTGNKPSEEAIKKTINEFMQMGKNLTAEQIREKISKLAKESAMTNAQVTGNTVTGNTTVSEPSTVSTQTVADSVLNYETVKQVSPIENKPSSISQDTTRYDTDYSSLYTLTSKQNSNTSISEDTGKYDTKIVDTKEIMQKENNFEEESQKPGDILLSIIQDREKPIPSVPAGQFDDMYAQIFGTNAGNTKDKENEENKNNANDIVNSNMSIFEDSEEFKDKVIPHKLIGIAFNTYIILEIKDELYVLDQHAAHERIMYEKVKKNYYSDEDKDSQLMLLPDVINLTHKEMDIARENMDKFEKAGFVLEEFGENTIKLTGVPNICLDLDTKELFLETLDEINTVARTAKQEIEERFIATIACKAAVKANMALTVEEVESLLEELLKLPNPFTCPHGRPTAIKLSKMDIERKFARRK